MKIRKPVNIALAILFTLLFNLQSKVAAEVVHVDFEVVKPKGYLKHDYRAGVFHIKNETDSQVKIYGVDFSGDKPIDYATEEARSHDKAALKVLWAFGIGFFWVFLIPLAVALVVTPFILIKRGMTRSKTRKEQWEYNEKAPREVIIEAGETEELAGIFPEEMLHTRLRFSAKNLSSGKITHYEEKYILDEDAYEDLAKEKAKAKSSKED